MIDMITPPTPPTDSEWTRTGFQRIFVRALRGVPTSLIGPLLPILTELRPESGDHLHVFKIGVGSGVTNGRATTQHVMTATAVIVAEAGPAEVWQWHVCDENAVAFSGHAERVPEAIGQVIAAFLHAVEVQPVEADPWRTHLPGSLDEFDDCPF